MSIEYLIVIGLMSFAWGYVTFWAIAQIRKVWRLYIMGKEIQKRFDTEVMEILMGENDDR